jgi:hypothetical protein
MVSSLPNKTKLWSNHNAQSITKTNTFKLSYNRSEMELKRVRNKKEEGANKGNVRGWRLDLIFSFFLFYKQ